MKNVLRYGISVLALLAMITARGANIAEARAPRSYILNGYSFGGLADVGTRALEAKLKHHKGDRITRADVDEDAGILIKELKTRHISGHLFTTWATNDKKGRAWVIFDVLDRQDQGFFKTPRHLEVQRFEGFSGLSPEQLSKASGLRHGDPLSPDKVQAARRAIVAAYAKVTSGKKVRIGLQMQGRTNGGAILTWTVRKPN